MPTPHVRPRARALLVLLALLFAPGAAGAAHAPIISSSATPEVCQVPKEPAPVDCNAAELHAVPSVEGGVSTRIVASVALPTDYVPADEQIIVGRLFLWPTDGGGPIDATWRWGKTFDTSGDPRATFAEDPYFWTGASGDASTPRGRASVEGQLTDLGEMLDRARSATSKPIALYLDLPNDAEARSFYGPAAADPSKRPSVSIGSTPGLGNRSVYSFTDAARTAHHRFRINDGNGNLMIEATDATLPGTNTGPVERFSNSLGGTIWANWTDAQQVYLSGAGLAFQAPTGETVSSTNDAIMPGGGSQDLSVDRPVGESFSDSPFHRSFLSQFGFRHDVEARDSDGTLRTYGMPGVDPVSEKLVSGPPSSITTTDTTADPDYTDDTVVRIARAAGTIALSDRNFETVASGTLRSDGEIGSLTKEGESDPFVTYDYDDTGRVTAVHGPDGTISYDYTGPLLTTVTDTDGYAATISYDARGRVLRLEVRRPSGVIDTFQDRTYPATAPECAAIGDTDHATVAVNGAADSATWCATGFGAIRDRENDPAPLPPLAPVVCTETPEYECPSPGPDPTLEGTGARAGKRLATNSEVCGTPTTDGGTAARQVLGIQDDFNSSPGSPIVSRTMWASDRYDCLSPRWTRRIVAYNIADGNPKHYATDDPDTPTVDERTLNLTLRHRYNVLAKFVQDAKDHNVRVIISFNECGETAYYRTQRSCATPPSANEYARAVKRFLNDPAFKSVKVFTAFNEPNLQRNKKNYLNTIAKASLAGEYWYKLSVLCKHRKTGTATTPCTPLAGDLSDYSLGGTTDGRLSRWMKEYTEGMGSTIATRWAVHYYDAVTMRGKRGATPCQRADIKVTKDGGPCWGAVSRYLRAVHSAVYPDDADKPMDWYLTEGGPTYRKNGGAAGPASEGAYYGPSSVNKDERAKLRANAAYAATYGLATEYPKLGTKWKANIKAVVQYMWEFPDGASTLANDTALAGALPGANQPNLLREEVRPPWIAWCEAMFGQRTPAESPAENAGVPTGEDYKCWQFEEGTNLPPVGDQ